MIAHPLFQILALKLIIYAYNYFGNFHLYFELSYFFFGRNLHVAEDNSVGDDADEEDIVSGLHCKIVVRFEKHKDFYDALKILCGRSLQKVYLLEVEHQSIILTFPMVGTPWYSEGYQLICQN